MNSRPIGHQSDALPLGYHKTQLIFWLVKLMFLIQSSKKIGDNLISKLEICVAPASFEDLCVREGELYLPDSFLRLSEINEIISVLCIVALLLLPTALFFYATCSLYAHMFLYAKMITIISPALLFTNEEKVPTTQRGLEL